MSRFRDFLYMDVDTIESYLSSVEGGLYDSEDQETSTQGSGGVEVNQEFVPTDAHVSDRRRRTMQQNSSTRFTRLVDHIEKEESVYRIPALTDDQDAFPAEGVFCQFTGQIEIPAIVAILANGADFLKFGRFVQGIDASIVASSDLEKMEAIAIANENLGNKANVTLAVEGLDRTVILPLRKDVIATRFNELSGRVTAFGRVSEVIGRDDSYKLVEIPGEVQLNRQQRRAQARNNSGGMEFDRELNGPALVLHVLAIYR